MGKQFAGPFANWSGKVGNVVGRQVQGRTVLAIYQPVVNNPRTAAQVAQRTDFGLMTKYMSMCSPCLRYGFHDLDGYRTGNYFSAAVGYNLKNANAISGDPSEVDTSKVIVSQGKIDLPYSPSAVADGTTLSLTWADNSGMGEALATDKVMVLAVNKFRGVSVFNAAAANRSERNCTVNLPSAWTGNDVDVYMAMRRGEYECSMSEHLGQLPL